MRPQDSSTNNQYLSEIEEIFYCVLRAGGVTRTPILVTVTQKGSKTITTPINTLAAQMKDLINKEFKFVSEKIETKTDLLLFSLDSLPNAIRLAALEKIDRAEVPENSEKALQKAGKKPAKRTQTKPAPRKQNDAAKAAPVEAEKPKSFSNVPPPVELPLCEPVADSEPLVLELSTVAPVVQAQEKTAANLVDSVIVNDVPVLLEPVVASEPELTPIVPEIQEAAPVQEKSRLQPIRSNRKKGRNKDKRRLDKERKFLIASSDDEKQEEDSIVASGCDAASPVDSLFASIPLTEANAASDQTPAPESEAKTDFKEAEQEPIARVELQETEQESAAEVKIEENALKIEDKVVEGNGDEPAQSTVQSNPDEVENGNNDEGENDEEGQDNQEDSNNEEQSADSESDSNDDPLFPPEDDYWYGDPAIVITGQLENLKTGFYAGRWSSLCGYPLWWSPYWNRSQAIHLFRRKLTIPYRAPAIAVVSLVIEVPNSVSHNILHYMLKWVESHPSPYIRHRTMAISLVGARFALLGELNHNGNFLVFTLRYPEDRDLNDYLDAYASFNNYIPMMENVKVFPHGIIPSSTNDIVDPIVDYRKYSVVLGGKTVATFNNLDSLTAALKVYGPHLVIPYGCISMTKAGDEEEVVVVPERQLVIAPIPGMPFYENKQLYNVLLELLDSASVNSSFNQIDHVNPFVDHIELIHFVAIPEFKTYALHLQVTAEMPQDLYDQANTVLGQYAAGIMTLTTIPRLKNESYSVERMPAFELLQIPRIGENEVSPTDMAYVANEHAKHRLTKLPPLMVEFHLPPLALWMTPAIAWRIVNIHLFGFGPATVAAAMTSLTYLPRYTHLIGIVQRLWLKKMDYGEYFIGFAVELVEGQEIAIQYTTPLF